MAALEIKQRNAIKWKLTQGYRPVIGGLRNLHGIELQVKDTNEVETFDIDELVGEYDQQRKEDARARAAEKRIMANTAKNHAGGGGYVR